jgi:hypothetical protein
MRQLQRGKRPPTARLMANPIFIARIELTLGSDVHFRRKSGPHVDVYECPLMAHRDRSHFGGRTSLSGHNGHGWSGGRPDPDANDPEQKSSV